MLVLVLVLVLMLMLMLMLMLLPLLVFGITPSSQMSDEAEATVGLEVPGTLLRRRLPGRLAVVRAGSVTLMLIGARS
jgi:hypothetical protein